MINFNWGIYRMFLWNTSILNPYVCRVVVVSEVIPIFHQEISTGLRGVSGRAFRWYFRTVALLTVELLKEWLCCVKEWEDKTLLRGTVMDNILIRHLTEKCAYFHEKVDFMQFFACQT